MCVVCLICANLQPQPWFWRIIGERDRLIDESMNVMRFRARHTVWLGALGVMLGVAALGSGTLTLPVTLTLLALFGAAMVASLFDFRPQQLRNTLTSSPLAMMKMTPQAREASDRARRRSSYLPPGLTLLDVGLITLQSGPEGTVMRRGRTISLDDKGVRPYITLSVGAEYADRKVVTRFEMIDHNGQTQYVHEMENYLRDGEVNILADTQLPLLGNDKLTSGEWDLRVSVDRAAVGILSFTTTPSITARNRMLMQDADEPRQRLRDEPEESEPVSLEELLRESQRRDRRQ